MKNAKAGAHACALAMAALVAGCASGGSGGSGTLTGVSDAGVVQVMTGDGEMWHIPRGSDLRSTPTAEVSPAEAWRVLPLVYEMLGIELTTILPAERRLGSGDHRFQREILNRRPSDFFECGSDPGLLRPLADQVPIDARIETHVVGSGDGSEIRTAISATARRSGGAPGRANCESTGLLEVIIARLTQELVSGTGS
jgi:hypothetical protein